MFAGIAALAMAFALGLPATLPGISVSGTVQPRNFAPWDSLGLEDPNSGGLGVADTFFEFATRYGDRQSEWATFTKDRDSSTEYVLIDPGATSFDDRFGGAFDWPGSRRQTAETEEPASDIPPRSPDLGGHATGRNAVRKSPRMPVSASPPASLPKKQLRVADAADEDSNSSPPDVADHTAIYDIAAHMVYLPDGHRLEAHSGLGGRLDNPRYVSEKMWGPTPPNVYDLTLREELFHGVRALRLIPVGSGNMYGRTGILAHTYMLGPNGQSNGCVSFRDYQTFLNAYLSGQVTRLAVVEHLANPPGRDTALGWLPETIKALFVRS